MTAEPTSQRHPSAAMGAGGACGIHGLYTGPLCPRCSNFAGLPYDQQPSSVPPVTDARPWQTCPVCFGKGIVPNNFYLSPGLQWSGTSTTPETCRSCAGRGIVR